MTIRDSVRRVFSRKPRASSRWVQAAVAARHPEVAHLTPRSFHAKHVLPVRREMAGRDEARSQTSAKRGDIPSVPRAGSTSLRVGAEDSQMGVRDAARRELIGIARDVAAARGPVEMLDAVIAIDERMERLLETVRQM